MRQRIKKGVKGKADVGTHREIRRQKTLLDTRSRQKTFLDIVGDVHVASRDMCSISFVE